MDKLKGVTKGGWHPSKEGMGKKISLRGDSKGINQIAGWMGHGKDTSGYNAEDHQSAPLSSLKDPDSFGPPPIRRGTGDPHAPASPAKASTGGLGGPIQTGTVLGQESRLERERREAREAEEEAEKKANAPPVPYRADTTGLSTANLPPPPKFRGDTGSPVSATVGRPKPSLPPRLPPRGAAVETPPPRYEEAVETKPSQGILNQGALNRLGQAGVSVPGLGIGSNGGPRPPPVPARSHDSTASSPQTPVQTPASPLGHGGQMNELQQRFAKMKPAAGDAAAAPPSPAQQIPSSPIGKKAPPPPPPKKAALHSDAVQGEEPPPPVPMASKPSFK